MTESLTQKYQEITADGFHGWLKAARPGEKLEYYRGFLAIDREKSYMVPALNAYAHVYYEPMHSLGLAVWRSYEQGLVELVQKKVGPDNYRYFVIKRRNRTKVKRRWQATA